MYPAQVGAGARAGAEQMVLQIADGDFRGMSVWWDAPIGLQEATRNAVEAEVAQFEYEHTYGSQPETTIYQIDLAAMTSTNPDSGQVRQLRVSSAIMWTQ